MKHKVIFEDQVKEYEPGDLVTIDITEYVIMPGAFYTFWSEDIKLTQRDRTLEFIMPDNDVMIDIEKKVAGTPFQQGPIPKRIWTCLHCGENKNTGKFCIGCGRPH